MGTSNSLGSMYCTPSLNLNLYFAPMYYKKKLKILNSASDYERMFDLCVIQ